MPAADFIVDPLSKTATLRDGRTLQFGSDADGEFHLIGAGGGAELEGLLPTIRVALRLATAKLRLTKSLGSRELRFG